MVMKSQNGKTDEDGNYIFEVEASNENLDLQNQIIQQKALIKSKEYFMTNGVISDDHQHKVRNEDGEIENHLDKVIGEPLEVWTDGTKTFVKGKLYRNNKYAKGYIDLLKAGSSRVHASVGGIKPVVHKHKDGTETISDFLWNDLALTISPVNWTVGSAKFAKSLSNIEFCKAIQLTESESFPTPIQQNNEKVIQKEDIERKIHTVDSESNKDDIINEVVIRIDTGELETQKEIKAFLKEKGISDAESQEIINELIKQGEVQMKKSNFLSQMADFAKSLKKSDCKKSEDEKDEEDDDFDFELDEDELDDKEIGEDEDADDDKKVTKSIEDDENEYYEASEIFKSLNDRFDSLESENESLRAELNATKAELLETQEAMTEVTKSLSEYLSTPIERKTVVQKSVGNEAMQTSDGYVSVKPDAEDFKTFKDSVAKAIREKELDPYKITALNSAFQKSMKGEKILKSEWNSICSIVNKFGR